MPRFPSLPTNAQVPDILRRFPKGAMALLEYHDAVLRGDSALSVAERELIAAYVSGVNACGYCHGAHRTIATAFGIPAETFDLLMTDPVAANVPERLLPLLQYVRKLTEAPSRVTDTDAQAVYAAGWDEDALFDAISVCALFNFMNRIVEGCGLRPSPEGQARLRARIAEQGDAHSYRDIGRMLGMA